MLTVLPLTDHQGLLLVDLLFISLTASGMSLFYYNVHCRTYSLENLECAILRTPIVHCRTYSL
jgi:hypothetical protein